MDNAERLREFLETGFLSPLLNKEAITDVSYNGEALFYEDRIHGRRRSAIKVTDEQIGAFLRQIANLSEKQFSYLNPVLDVSFSRYRLNATFLSITRVYERKRYSFSLRIGHDGSAVEEDESFFPKNTRRILLDAVRDGKSIVIAGETGAGKTELQKYLIMNLPIYSRAIVIDNLGELERCRGNELLDLTSWTVDERFEDSRFPALIRNALRNNPDYLIVAEARGEEMMSALNAVMSGHPIITTLHAKDIAAIPYRMARLAQSGGSNLHFDDLLADIYHHFDLVVYVSKSVRDGLIYRRISAVGQLNEETRQVDLLYDEKELRRKRKA